MNNSTHSENNGSRSSDVGADANVPEDVIDAELAAMLADVTMWVEPPSGLGDRIADAVRSEAELGVPEANQAGVLSLDGRRRTWLRPALLGAAAAIVFLFGGIVVLSALSGVEETETFSAELISTGLIPDVGGGIDVTSFDSGLQIDLSAPGLPRRDDGAFYEGWVRTVDGNLFPVGTFHDGDDVTLWAGVELDRIELFTITLETTAGPDDPAQTSSGEVVLKAAITP
jgi:hypothetical protein